MKKNFIFGQTIHEVLLKIWRNEMWLVSLLLILALVFRFKGLTSSVTDWHAFRQVDTASVSVEYVKNGVDLLRPTYHDLSNIASGKENPQGYRMVEFPIMNALVAWLVRVVPLLDLVVVSRVISIIFSLGTVATLFFLGKRWGNQTIGFLSALIFAVMPYMVFYSRVILPEPILTFFLCFAILTFDLWLEQKNWGWYLTSLLSFTLALLLKPFVIFFTPILGYLAIRHFRQKVFFQPALYLYGVAVLPILAWRKWIEQFPEGIPANDWLFNSLDGKPIRFRPSWARWIVWERSAKLFLGGAGAVAVAASWLHWDSWKKRTQLFEALLVWGGCVLLYTTVIAAGNVRHDYYQVLTLPFYCLAFGQGLWVISQLRKVIPLLVMMLVSALIYFGIYWVPIPGQPDRTIIPLLVLLPLIGTTVYLLFQYFQKKPSPVMGAVTATALLVMSYSMNSEFVHGFYRTRPDWEVAGAAADRVLPKDAKVIAHGMGDSTFLFQTKRKGWPIGFEIDKKISLGAQYYITTSYDDEARELEQRYTVVKKTPEYLIINLTQPKAGAATPSAAPIGTP